jgi:Fe-S cluster assembly scaffold protein SufB
MNEKIIVSGKKEYNIFLSTDYSGQFYLKKNAELKLNVAASSDNAQAYIDVFLNGVNASTENNFILLGKDGDKKIQLNIMHNAPSTKSVTNTKGISDGKSKIIFNGLIKIMKNAQKSDAHLSCHALKLSKESHVQMIPSLLIDANDVKASHTASVTEINEDELFYMRSRGIDAANAKRLLISGFFEPVIANISKELREKMKKVV